MYQRALYFFGTNPGDGTAFPREARATTPPPLDGELFQVTIDYDGVLREADSTDKTTQRADAATILQPLRTAIPAGQYTAIAHTGISFGTGLGFWVIGFTEFVDRDGVVHRVPEPPNPDGRGIHFGTDNSAAVPAVVATSSTLGTTAPARLTQNDPLFLFQHGGEIFETAIAGSDFINATRIPEGEVIRTRTDGTTVSFPYDVIRIEPTESIGITAQDLVSGALTPVENPNGTGGRADGRLGHDRFTEVRAGEGIQIRATGGETNALEIINACLLYTSPSPRDS